MKKIFMLCVILITCSSCSEFALLASGSSMAISQNAYAKVYSGVARGRKVNVEIAIDSNNLTYLVKNAEEKQGEAYSSVEDQPEPKILVYSGNGIFRDGRTNFIFQSRENDIEELRMDFGSGYSILKAN